jgi:exodeoxyribonuclease VII small subunit
MTDNLSFEQAFKRLEVILEKMNSAALPLEEALSLYEEADRLVGFCSKQLQSAEKKVQVLIKNRQNDLLLDENERPQMQPYEIK